MDAIKASANRCSNPVPRVDAQLSVLSWGNMLIHKTFKVLVPLLVLGILFYTVLLVETSGVSHL
jgi:hypothetical protein